MGQAKLRHHSRPYTPAEVAELANVCRRTVYRWLDTGYLPAVKIGPRSWGISQEVVTALLAGNLPPVVQEEKPSVVTVQAPALAAPSRSKKPSARRQ